jgi:hypothetical protein
MIYRRMEAEPLLPVFNGGADKTSAHVETKQEDKIEAGDKGCFC